MTIIRVTHLTVEGVIDLLEANDANMATIRVYRAADGMYRGSAERAW